MEQYACRQNRELSLLCVEIHQGSTVNDHVHDPSTLRALTIADGDKNVAAGDGITDVKSRRLTGCMRRMSVLSCQTSTGGEYKGRQRWR